MVNYQTTSTRLGLTGVDGLLLLLPQRTMLSASLSDRFACDRSELCELDRLAKAARRTDGGKHVSVGRLAFEATQLKVFALDDIVDALDGNSKDIFSTISVPFRGNIGQQYRFTSVSLSYPTR